MNKIIITIAALFVFSNITFAQPWADSTGFTKGAKISLHEVWGANMGYSDREETGKKAQHKYNTGKFVTVNVLNTGVDAQGNIKYLKKITIQGVYLGNVDATPFGYPGYTVDLYLKKDCQNLGLADLKKIPVTTVKKDTAVLIVKIEQAAPATKQHLDYAFMSTETGTQMKIYSEQNLDGSNTGNTTIIKVQGEPQPLYYYREQTHLRVYDSMCGCYVVKVKTLEPVKVRDTHVITFGY